MDKNLAADSTVILHLARRLSVFSEVRRTAYLLLNDEPPDSPQAIVDALDLSRSAPQGNRLLAAVIAPHLPFDERQRRDACGFLIGILDSEAKPDSSLLHALWVFAFFPFVSPIAPIIEQSRINWLRGFAARSLGRMECVESINALARALWDAPGAARTLGRDSVRRAAAESLVSVLPLMDESHRPLLDPETVPHLARALGSTDVPLALAILEAFRTLAGGEAVERVRFAAERGCSWKVRAAAAGLLPILEERRSTELASCTLLRSAESGDLLRPAVDDPTRWLRPADRAA